jgi:uncharacterized protein (DUF427 family)
LIDYPQMLTPVDHIEPVPRRVRGTIGGRVVLDTTRALYVWELPYFPQYYVPLADVDDGLLVDEHHPQQLHHGTARLAGVRLGDVERPSAARIYGDDALPGLGGTVHFEWDALDAWFEEDEQIFVHPRSPYTRVDALRSSRTVRVELEGEVLAESSSPVLVFETGLPTRFYLDRVHVDFTHLVPSDTVTACPYKGRTTGYWSVSVESGVHPDLAWSYDFPTRELLSIAGLIAFYDEHVDVVVDGQPRERPSTHFSK